MMARSRRGDGKLDAMKVNRLIFFSCSESFVATSHTGQKWSSWLSVLVYTKIVIIDTKVKVNVSKLSLLRSLREPYAKGVELNYTKSLNYKLSISKLNIFFVSVANINYIFA